VIGNVLGTPSYHSHYEDAATSGSNADTSIFLLGWSHQGGTTDGSVPSDPRVKSTLLRWGNYDTANGSAQWNSSEVPSALAQFANAVPSTNTLPASLFLPAKPAWFGAVAWPPIGPDVTGGQDPTGHVYKIPARLCYEKTAQSGGMLNFNAASCYAASVGAPTAPTNLRIVSGQ